MHLRYLIKPVCVQYGRLFSQKKRLSYPAQQGAGKGFVKGESVPLDPVLVSFAGAKVTPRRQAYLLGFVKGLTRRRRVETMIETRFAGAGARDCDWPMDNPAEGAKSPLRGQGVGIAGSGVIAAFAAGRR